MLDEKSNKAARELQKKLQSIRIEGEIGRGGTGVVYLGYQENLDRQVAVKVLASCDLFSKEELQRLQGEARAISRIKHPNVVHCYDAGFLEGGCFYIVMEYLPGQNLEELISERKIFSQRQAAKIIIQLAKGLAAAHEQKLIHRDIKPSNLIIDEKGHITITDFGLAIHDDSGRITKTGVVMGTPYYLAPEQAIGDELTHLVDIYSMGIVFYELLTGHLPIEDKNPFQAVLQRIQQPYFDPRKLEPSIVPQLAELICQMTKRKTEERTDSCHKVIEVLEKYLEDSKSSSLLSSYSSIDLEGLPQSSEMIEEVVQRSSRTSLGQFDFISSAPDKRTKLPQTQKNRAVKSKKNAPTPLRRSLQFRWIFLIPLLLGVGFFIFQQLASQSQIEQVKKEVAPIKKSHNNLPIEPKVKEIIRPTITKNVRQAQILSPSNQSKNIALKKKEKRKKNNQVINAKKKRKVQKNQKVSIKILTRPSRAKIYLGSQKKYIGKSPLVFRKKMTGSINLYIKKQGYFTSRLFILKKGEKRSFYVSLRKVKIVMP